MWFIGKEQLSTNMHKHRRQLLLWMSKWFYFVRKWKKLQRFAKNHYLFKNLFSRFFITTILLSISYKFLDIDFCLSQPCLNNARCVSSDGHYFCVCAPGWTGIHCNVGKNYTYYKRFMKSTGLKP